LDEQGNLFIADSGNNRVRRVDMSSGVITTVAGNGTQGNTGDEGPAVTAQLDYPSGVAVDGAGNVFIANGAVRRVDGNTGIITTVAGGITTVAGGMSPWDVTIDKSGNLYITNGASIQRIDASTGVITTIAGNGSTGYTGDGGPATKAELFSPNGVAVDSAGNLFIADTDNGAVRRVDANTGIITTVAGGGTGGDGGLATGALLIRPAGVAVSAAGNLFIADLWWGKVFRVDHITGIINTVAGNGTWGFSGDGASALAAELDYPGRVAVNGSDIYIGDIWNNRIRHIQLPAFVILTTGSLTFGSQQLNTTSSAQTVTLTNSGDARLTVTSIAASGDFSESDNCSSGVPVSASCTISVTFKPTESGPRSGAIIITDSAGDSPEVISLTGTATGLLPSTVTVTPSSLSITTALALSVTVAVSGGSGNPTPTGSVILSGGGYTSMATSLTSGSATINIPAVSLAIGSDTLSASYTPDSNSSSIYNTATGTSTAVTVTQAKTTPTINWSTPSPISYDIALSATQLDASSTVAGTFAYTPAAGTVLTAGAQTLSVTLTPTDTTDYSTATASVTLTVNKATPTITWATPAAVTVGTALSATQLNPTASVTGNFSYNPTSGTVMSTTGNYTLTAIFSPNDTTDYNNNFAQVVLVVNPVSKTTPTITWATPASITYGTPLSTTQQNATASVTGTYLYSPSPGTVLPAGSQILNVTFTPSDTTDYNTATATVTLTVNSPSNPVPVMGSMTPAIGNAGGVAFTLTVNGAGFLANSTVYWGTSALSTTYVSATQLTAQVTAADIATAGAYAITVQTPAPGGGTSSALQFEVDTAGSTATGPTFTLTTVSVTAGSPASYPVTLPSTVTTSTVSCLNLPPGASCSYSATSNTVTITTSPTTPAGTYNVTVVFNETVSGAATSWILLPILLLPLVFLRRRMAARGVWIAACLGLVLLAGMAYSTGCGGGGGGGNSGGGSGGGGGGGGTQTHQVTSSAVVTLTVK
jgi:sugar lactone lactonase YvrE